MTGVVYTVTVTLPDDATAGRFVAWLTGGHIAEVLAGGANCAYLTRPDGEPNTVAIIYGFPSRSAFEAYERDHAPRLREEGRRLFPPESGVIYRRTVAEVLSVINAPGAK